MLLMVLNSKNLALELSQKDQAGNDQKLAQNLSELKPDLAHISLLQNPTANLDHRRHIVR